MSAPLVEVRGLRKSFPITKGVFVRRTVGEVVATNNVSFDIHEGEVLGFVGESGSGKSTIGRLVLGLTPADAGEIRFGGRQISNLGKRDFKPFRRELQMVFQDPLSSLNPRRTAAENIARPLLNFSVDKGEIAQRIDELLELVGLERYHANRFPHEFSGGQCQRIAIARALALGPRFLFLDEAVSALDVSIQAQILNLLEDIKMKLKLTYLFVSHDLKIVSYMSDRIMVLYKGSVAESGPSREIYDNPQHPYTKDLLASVLDIKAPTMVPQKAGTIHATISDSVATGRPQESGVAEDDASTVSSNNSGCAYARLCPHRRPHCTTLAPELVKVGVGHFAACHLLAPSKLTATDAVHAAIGH